MTKEIELNETVEKKKYKVIIPYTESATPKKIFKIEYEITASNNMLAKRQAENQFNLYYDSSSASWVRTMNKGGIRVMRIIDDVPQTVEEIDKLCEQLINNTNKEEICDILKKLSMLEDASTTSYILRQTKNKDVEIASLAVEALENIGDPTSLLAVKNLYHDETPVKLKVKIIAAISKIALPEDNILDFMSNALKDDVKKVRDAAARAFDILENRALASGWVNWIKARQKRISCDSN